MRYPRQLGAHIPQRHTAMMTSCSPGIRGMFASENTNKPANCKQMTCVSQTSKKKMDKQEIVQYLVVLVPCIARRMQAEERMNGCGLSYREAGVGIRCRGRCMEEHVASASLVLPPGVLETRVGKHVVRGELFFNLSGKVDACFFQCLRCWKKTENCHDKEPPLNLWSLD